jgi:hypothetical protein
MYKVFKVNFQKKVFMPIINITNQKKGNILNKF